MGLSWCIPLATLEGSGVKISWVVAAGHGLDPTISLEQIKSVGPVWGSWQTWRSCNTDNVICHQQQKARELLDRAFQAVCNFYIPRNLYEPLARPVGVRLYDGDYDGELDDVEDIVALHLAGASSDIVLIAGFDWTVPETVTDRFARHKIMNRHGLMRSAISNMPNTQWVAIDCEHMDKSYQTVTNLTCDTMKNALQLLI
jgi:hypothetical protein